MNKRSIVLSMLLGMILYDLSLHLVELFQVIKYHPLYPYFTDFYIYTVFWCVYWGCAAVLALYGVILYKEDRYAYLSS